MTPLQQLHFELQLASTEDEAFLVWTRHREQLRDASLILSVPGRSPFGVKLLKRFGKNARLISAFAHDGLYFLNDRIYTDINAGRESKFSITHTVSFDTNAASYLRGLFTNRDTPAHQDLQQLLLQVYPGRLNWQVNPYLMENSEAILHGKDDRVIFETILAAEKLEGIDIEHLRQCGQLRLDGHDQDHIERAAKRLSDAARHFANGTHQSIVDRWEAMYVVVLFMTLEQIRKPGVERAPKKLKSLVRFMDEELHALFLDLQFIAWDWFSGGEHTSIFRKLQRNAPDILAKAQNISWDILHLTQLRQEATFVGRDGAFLVPFFLTFDRALADLVSLCGIRSCLIGGTFHYPMCFPNRDPEPLFLSAVGRDEEFVQRYLSPEANARRGAWLDQHGRPDLSALRQNLEAELVKLGL